MIEKPNYCIDELEIKFGFTNHDITYLINEGLLLPFVQVSNFNFIAGRNIDNGFLGNATGIISGKVFLLQSHVSELLKKGKLSTNSFWLKGREDILSWRTAKPPNIENVKNEVYSWSPTTIDNVTWPLLIKNGLETEPNAAKELLKRIPQLLGKNTPEDKAFSAKTLEKYSDQVTVCRQLTFNTEDVLVSSENIILIQAKMSNRSPTTVNALRNLVDHLVKMYPTKGGAALYRILVSESKNENDEIDPKSILIDADEESTFYRGLNGKELKVSRKRFLNIVSEIKNKK